MPQINLSDEMLDILIEAMDDAINYNAEIMDFNEGDEFVEHATKRHDAQIDALAMLNELKLMENNK